MAEAAPKTGTPTAQPPAADPTGPEAGGGSEAGGAAGVSKKAAKKAEAKAKKEAQKAQRELELAVHQQHAADPANDPAKDNYGKDSSSPWPAALAKDAEEVQLRTLGEAHVGKVVVLRAWLQNSRMQGAKMAFMELREEENWAIQGVLVANVGGGGDAAGAEKEKDGSAIISRTMVKWVGGISVESFVVVEATVEKPLEPVKSCRVADYELHVRKCFVLAAAPAMLGLTLASANRAVTNFSDEEVAPEEKADAAATGAAAKAPEKGAEAASTMPAATMLTHLDNIVMHKRAPVQQAIAVC
jgi:aspartyl-tRNA synthetase